MAQIIKWAVVYCEQQCNNYQYNNNLVKNMCSYFIFCQHILTWWITISEIDINKTFRNLTLFTFYSASYVTHYRDKSVMHQDQFQRYFRYTIANHTAVFQTDSSYSWLQNFVMFWMLDSFFWVMPRHLNFMFRRFGTRVYSIFRGGVNRNTA